MTDPHGGVVGQPLDQGGPIFQCMYCGATFPHQSKLTRHILSHSLETLKYRESTHYLHMPNFGHDIQPPQHFGQRTLPTIDSLEPPDGSPMEIEFAAAAAAAAAASGGNSISSNSGGDQGNVVLCKFCGKSFPDVTSLITHLPVHTGDRPFKCEYCGKAFKLRHHMKDHCRVHTGKLFLLLLLSLFHFKNIKIIQNQFLEIIINQIFIIRVLSELTYLEINMYFYNLLIKLPPPSLLNEAKLEILLSVTRISHFEILVNDTSIIHNSIKTWV